MNEKLKQWFFVYAAPPLFLCVAFIAALICRWSVLTVRDWVSPAGAWISYYNDSSYKQKAAVRPIRSLAAYYPARPAFRVKKDSFYARIDGWLRIPENGKYEFASLAHGGLRLYLDDRLLIDGWEERAWSQSSKHADNVELSKGYHKLRMEFYNNGGNARFRVEWCGGVVPPRTTVDSEYLRKEKP